LTTSLGKLDESGISSLTELWNISLLTSLNFHDFEQIFLFFSSSVYELCDSYWARMTCLKAINKISEGMTSSSIRAQGVKYSDFPRAGWNNFNSCITFESNGISIFIPNFVSRNPEDKLKDLLNSTEFKKILLKYNTYVSQLKPITIARYIECADEIMKYKDVIHKVIQVDDLSRFIHSYLVYKGNKSVLELNNRAYSL
jgi:hypothetical protein